MAGDGGEAPGVLEQLAAALQTQAEVSAGLKKFVEAKGRGGEEYSVPRHNVKFDGLATQNLSFWVKSAEEDFRILKYARDAEKVCYAGTLLEGDAKVWFLSLGARRPDTWGVLVELLQDTFLIQDEQRALREQLHALRQVGPLAEYVSKFRRLYLQVQHQMDEESSIAYFTAGLQPATRQEVRYRSPPSLTEAIAVAQHFARTYELDLRPPVAATPAVAAARPTFARVAGAAINVVASASAPAGAAARPKLTPELREQLRREGKCFKCRAAGHMVSNCPERGAGPAGNGSHPT